MFTFAFVLSTVPSFPTVPNEAELLLKEMDAKIIAAKSLRIEFTIDDSSVSHEQRLANGLLVVADGNRFHYDLSGSIVAKVISDGKNVVSVFAKPAEKKSQLTPDWFSEVLKGWIGRGGTFVSAGKALEYAEKSVGERPGANKAPRLSNVRLLASEDLNGVKARVVEYDLAWPNMIGDNEAAKVRLWIDDKTKLPLRRTMTFEFGTEKKTYTAVHAKFELNPDLGENLFELPK